MKKPLLLAMLILGVKLATAQPRITAEEALSTAHRIETATNSGDASVLDHFFDFDSLLFRIRQKSHMMQDEGFFYGFSSGFKGSYAHYGSQIVASIKRGNYRLLRQYESNGTQHLFFRLLGPAGLNYHDYTLIRVRDSIKAADVYVYTIDEYISSNLATLSDMMGYSMEGLPADSSAVLKMTNEFKQKNYTQVKEDYEKLDNRYKNNKDIELIYIMACHQIEPSLYETALESFVSHHPDAPSGYLMMIDLYYLRKEYDKGLVAIDKINKLLGGDPVLDLYRGNFYILSGKPAESLACYERVYQFDPTIASNDRLLIIRYEGAGEKEKAKTVITDLKKAGAYHEDDFADLLTKYPDLK